MRPTSAPTSSAPTSDPIVALRAAARRDADAAFRAAALAMRVHRDEEAIPLLCEAVRHHPRDPRLWQMLGLAARNAGELAQAVEALARARSLAPADALIAHGIARARLEAGLPAIDDFLGAQRLAPTDGSVLQGLAAARFAQGDVAGATAGMAAAVAANPGWTVGHDTLANLRRMSGDADELRSYGEALRAAPRHAALWSALLSTLARAERFSEVAAVVDAARRAVGDSAALSLFAAIGADETGHNARAGAWFDALPADVDASTRIWRVRSLLRRGRIAAAADDALAGTARPGGGALWPYVALAWRALGDPRWQWLEGDPAFVRVVDIAGALGDREALASRLRALHIARDRPLDQSVRNGTQTDGPLLSRIEPEIVRLRDAIRAAVTDYIAALSAPDPSHPLLGSARAPIRFAGSWSVRLTDGGHHAEHVHSHGWISSALYISLPDAIGGAARAGWLTLGAAPSLLPDLAPFREIAPVPGTLVLFPSTMWHGTRPFAAGERLTVAFDIARMG